MNEIATTKAFQERVFEKIRADIGNLMTDDELKSLLNAAMQKAFFEPTRRTDSYQRTTDEPPVFVTLTRGLMQDRVSSAIEKWINEHPEEVNKIIREVLAGGIAGAIAMHFEMRFAQPLQQLRHELEVKGLVEKQY